MAGRARIDAAGARRALMSLIAQALMVLWIAVLVGLGALSVLAVLRIVAGRGDPMGPRRRRPPPRS